MSEQFNAATARKMTFAARSTEGAYKRKETDEVLAQIGQAASVGKGSCTTNHTDEVIMLRLTNLGFKVVFTPAYDQRESAYNTISW